MSQRYNNGSHYENHQRAAEMHEEAAHVHQVGELEHEGEHLSGHEQSRRSLEHSEKTHQPATNMATVGHGISAFGHDEIAALAHEIWESRGSPEGSSELDWQQAVHQLRSRAVSK
jgi:hypothetical protein